MSSLVMKNFRRLSYLIPTRRNPQSPTPEPITPDSASPQTPADDKTVDSSNEPGGKTLFAAMQESTQKLVEDPPISGPVATTSDIPPSTEPQVSAAEPQVPYAEPQVTSGEPQVTSAEPEVPAAEQPSKLELEEPITLVPEPAVEGKVDAEVSLEDTEVKQVRFVDVGPTHDEVHEIRVDDVEEVEVAPSEPVQPTVVEATETEMDMSHAGPQGVHQEQLTEPAGIVLEQPGLDFHPIKYEEPHLDHPGTGKVHWAVAQELTEEPQETEEPLVVEDPFRDQLDQSDLMASEAFFPVMMPVPSVSMHDSTEYQPPPIVMPPLHASGSTRTSSPSSNLNEVGSRVIPPDASFESARATQEPKPFLGVDYPDMENDQEESRPLLDASMMDTFDKTINGDVENLFKGVWPNLPMPHPLSQVEKDALPFPSSTNVGNPVPVYQTLGWSEYLLPDNTCYYFHATSRTVADIDLRNPELLHAITTYLSKPLRTSSPNYPSSSNRGGGFYLHSLMPGEEEDLVDLGTKENPPSYPPGYELWLQYPDHISLPGRHFEFNPVRKWVNHNSRTISDSEPFDLSGKGKAIVGSDLLMEDERLDILCRYWKYMESHPAHVELPFNAREDALEALTWSYTDRLMQSPTRVSGPFTQEESQELLSLLRNTDPTSPVHHTIHTRIISKVLLRMAEWRQSLNRQPKGTLSEKRSLTTAVRGEVDKRGFPFRRTILNFIMTFICWGIPYLYLEHEAAMLLENESVNGQGTRALLFGASVSLTAAIILSASVSFLSMRGIDNSMRVAAFVASLCAAASLASGFVTIYRHRSFPIPPPPAAPAAAPRVDGESLVVLSKRRSILNTLPLTFLSWSLVSYVVGIILYAIRGVNLGNGESFEPWVMWAVVAAWAVLSVVLIAMMVLIRRT